MSKKLIIIVSLLLLISINLKLVTADEKNLIPLKKPILTEQELKKKVLINILKPLPKPSLQKKEASSLKVADEKTIKPKFLLPKKKPLIAGTETKSKIAKSKFFSKKDFNIANKAISEMKKANWEKSIITSKKAKDKSIYNFIQWRYLLTKGNNASFYEYLNFINKNKDYPRISRIRYLAEHKLSNEKISPDKIISWFQDKEPLSGYGKMILGESYIQVGQVDRGINLIKEGWVTAELSKSDLRFFRKKFRKYLKANNYVERADYLAWNNKYWDLKRMLRYLPKDYELLYNARQLLMSKSYGVDQAIKNVPQKFKNDAGLNYDRLKWRRKRGRVDSSTEILLKIKNTKDYLVRPDKWWKEREIISRSLIYKKKYELAYKISSNHALTEGPDYAAAEWMSGWIALSFLKDPVLSKEHFENFYNNVSYPISISRGAYWLARSYKSLGDKENSEKWFKEASKYLTTYYGQLSFLELSPEKKFELSKDMEVDNTYREKFYSNELVKIVYLLDELDEDKYAKFILRHLANDNIEKGSEILTSELSTNIGRFDFAIQIAKIASYEKRFHNKYNYPIISTPKYINGRKIPESAFILSIIRQESEFDITANSHAGAKGLMQLMPYTAKLVAKQAKLPYVRSRLTTDPEYNINLGSHYIAGLMLNYDGAYPYAIAAYNAGPNRVKYWKRINKDPQKRQTNYVDWIELIKFKETRNYVQRVLENYNVYRYILEQEPIKMKDFFKDEPLY